MTTRASAAGIDRLEPAVVWRYFAGIAATPRPSKHEGRIRQHVKAEAVRLGLAPREDAAGNLVIEVPASTACEGAPVTVLQGHLDMVGEKNSGTDHDFDRDAIALLLDTDPTAGTQIVRADGTTLGADNGIGVAMALAVAASSEVIHGPLELVFTTDEEAGMTGAKTLTPGSFRGRRLLNLDSEEDDALYIGCAGGCDCNLSWALAPAVPPKGCELCRVSVTGLRGGHSGGDIHENRANAIKLLARVLRGVPAGFQLSALFGGSKRNAIPREASAVVAGPQGTIAALQRVARVVRDEAVRVAGDKNASVRVDPIPGDAPTAALSAPDSAKVIAALDALPNGVLGMHPTVPDLVETSNNVSTVCSTMAGDGFTVEVGTLARSSSEPRMEETLGQIAEVGRSAGATLVTANRYPEWAPNPQSPTLAVCRRVYTDLFGQAPRVAAIHAGLECGIIGEGVGGVDMVSFGPTIKGAHSPDERVYVASVQKSWRYLAAVLKALAAA